MFPNFEKCVTALADTLILQEKSTTDHLESVRAVSLFVLSAHANMPDYLRLIFRILTLIFDLWPCVVTGKPFHALSLARRIDQIRRWESSRLQFRSGLITFYRALTTFRFYYEVYRQDYELAPSLEQD